MARSISQANAEGDPFALYLGIWFGRTRTGLHADFQFFRGMRQTNGGFQLAGSIMFDRLTFRDTTWMTLSLEL